METEREASTGEHAKRRVLPLTLWTGMDLPAWASLLVRNRFAVNPRYLDRAVVATLTSPFCSLLRAAQSILFLRRLRRVTIEQAPIFIVGHWRTGTTLLHELLTLDERHTFPTTYECLTPSHFLLTEKTCTRLLRGLLPERRPMDSMPTGFERPQEDEFALCNLGLPSPYLGIAFPNRPPQCQEYLELRDITPAARRRWQAGFLRFLKQITLRSPKRIVLKSPTHTFRVPILLEMFPDARFVHIVRDPYAVFPSTMHMWKTLCNRFGLQRPRFEGLRENVLATFVRLYAKVEEARTLVSPSRFCELRFEDLLADPVGKLREVYGRLELGEFERIRPAIGDYMAAAADYPPARYELSTADRLEITLRWGDVIRRYGYPIRT